MIRAFSSRQPMVWTNPLVGLHNHLQSQGIYFDAVWSAKIEIEGYCKHYQRVSLGFPISEG